MSTKFLPHSIKTQKVTKVTKNYCEHCDVNPNTSK
ncbi:hypothetical protein T01_7622 [Trichinella spiralis]|uniref:Uncharacterized protein n=1 Tax=Trichinella spiralis TaxID=6334 RepID=A0A0V0YGX9_TRISP|nr:hypothetical protein T01_7622 [Trichinella spiralis]